VMPFAGRWNGSGSFSPDGAWFALGLAEQDFTTRAMLEPDWTRLALIEVETGAVTLAEGRIDNFATTPVWTADSRWLVFSKGGATCLTTSIARIMSRAGASTEIR